MSTPRAKPPAPKIVKDAGSRTARTVNVPPVDVGQVSDPATPINTRKTRGQFRTIEFSRAILQHGYFVTWRKSVVCPCANPDTGQVKMNCTHCDGSGFFFFDPLKIRGVMSNFARNVKAFEKFGSWVEGTSSITVEANNRLGFGDQIEMLDSVMTHSEWIRKGNRHGSRSRLPVDTDCARYRILRMVQALVYDEEQDKIYALEEGQHFEITQEGWIRWLAAASEIEDDVTISLIYEYHPIFIVTSHPHASREGTVENKNPTLEVVSLPVQAFIKLDFLLETSKTPPSMLAPLVNGRDRETPAVLGARGC